MLSNLGRLLIHFVGGALVCAQLAYWAIRLMTPAPAPAPAPVRVAAVHDPDAVLLARAFGQVERAAPAAIANIQVAGVFAAGADSAAVFVVGDKPARAVRLGQEVAPGSTLVEVEPQSVTLESGGVRRQLRVPNLPVASSSGPLAGGGFERLGNVLTAPSVDTGATASTPASRQPITRSPAAIVAPRPEPRPEPSPMLPARREMPGRPNPPQ
jgi:general secretion pathway protein C